MDTTDCYNLNRIYICLSIKVTFWVMPLTAASFLTWSLCPGILLLSIHLFPLDVYALLERQKEDLSELRSQFVSEHRGEPEPGPVPAGGDGQSAAQVRAGGGRFQNPSTGIYRCVVNNRCTPLVTYNLNLSAEIHRCVFNNRCTSLSLQEYTGV